MDKVLSARQLEILDSAMRLIAENGVQGFTMRQVGLALGISEPAVYRHFASKFAILEGLLDLFASQVEELSEAYLRGQKGGIRQFFSVLLERLEANRVWSAVIFSEEIFQNEPVLAVRVKSIMDAVEKALVDHVRKLSLQRHLPPRHVAWMFLGSIRLLVTRWRLGGYAFGLCQEGEALLDSLCHLHPSA